VACSPKSVGLAVSLNGLKRKKRYVGNLEEEGIIRRREALLILDRSGRWETFRGGGEGKGGKRVFFDVVNRVSRGEGKMVCGNDDIKN